MIGYIFQFTGHGAFAPHGRVEMTPDQIEAHNAQLERQELAAWAEKPTTFNAYVSTDSSVTTWRGTKLGHIVYRSCYRHNFGIRFEAITVRGNNGAIYHGRYSMDNQQIVHLRKSRKA